MVQISGLRRALPRKGRGLRVWGDMQGDVIADSDVLWIQLFPGWGWPRWSMTSCTTTWDWRKDDRPRITGPPTIGLSTSTRCLRSGLLLIEKGNLAFSEINLKWHCVGWYIGLPFLSGTLSLTLQALALVLVHSKNYSTLDLSRF